MMVPSRWISRAVVVAFLLMGIPGMAQADGRYLLPAGTEISLVTAEPLSSKTKVKGDMVALSTAADVVIEGNVVIPKGTVATGQITDAQAKGAMGMSGRLALRPLYIRMGDIFIRLGGSARGKGTVTAGAVVGMVLLTPGFTGRSAEIPEGTMLTGVVDHGVALPSP